MLWFKNFNGDFVAKGYTLNTDEEIKKTKNALYVLGTLQFPTAVALADKLHVYDNEGRYIGDFLVLNTEDAEHEPTQDLWTIKNVQLEKVNDN